MQWASDLLTTVASQTSTIFRNWDGGGPLGARRVIEKAIFHNTGSTNGLQFTTDDGVSWHYLPPLASIVWNVNAAPGLIGVRPVAMDTNVTTFFCSLIVAEFPVGSIPQPSI